MRLGKSCYQDALSRGCGNVEKLRYLGEGSKAGKGRDQGG